jgi:hypothetical protein
MKITKIILATALTTAATLSLAKIEALAFGNQVELAGLEPAQSYQLEILTPDGNLNSFPVNDTNVFSVNAADIGMNTLVDGQYKYQFTTVIVEKNRRTNQAPDKNNLSDSKTEVFSGVFTVKNGNTVIDEGDQLNDQQILDDQIVVGSQCVGQDCVNGENFGFDTIRLKENNLRIKFQDTSNSASFPTNDWQLTANDSSNGGANKFSIDDIDGGRTPFTIEAGARSHALYVDDGGRVGFGTSTPVVENHIVDGDSPTVRLEQNGTSGWTPQTWDVAGNESGFFVRDVTNGSKLSFRIAPNSADKSIFIQTDGIEFLNNTTVIDNDNRFGLGTNDPSNNIHVVETTGKAGFVLENQSTDISWKFVNKNSSFQIDQIGGSGSVFNVFANGALKVGNDGVNTNFDMDSNGNVTIQGALTQNSDVNTKENIQLVNTSEILDKVMSLPISVWNYKFDEDSVKHLGPMAQDFFAHFNLGHSETKIATIDTSGVALASIKELGTQLQQKEAEINNLKEENKALSSRLEAIEEKLKTIK